MRIQDVITLFYDDMEEGGVGCRTHVMTLAGLTLPDGWVTLVAHRLPHFHLVSSL